MRYLIALAAWLGGGCTGNVIPAPPSQICGRAAGPIVMQTTSSGECVTMSIRRLEGAPPEPIEGFDVSGPYWIDSFQITRAACSFPAAPFDSSSSLGYAPVGAAVSSDEDGVVHLRVQAEVQFQAREPHPAVTRTIDVDLEFVESEVSFCTSS